MNSTQWLLMWTCVATVACSSAEAPVVGPEAATVEVVGNANSQPVETAEIPPSSRAVRRLKVAQLRNAIGVVAGTDGQGETIAWQVQVGNQRFDALSSQALAPTLGEPDYVQTTTEPAEPTPLYAKFADDMARSVCGQMVAADQSKSTPQDRALTRFIDWDAPDDAAAIAQNLRYLRLRFLGDRVADGDTETIAPLQTVYDTVHAEMGPVEAWRAVCVTLLTSPEFHLY